MLILEKKKSKINDLSIHLKELKKEKQGKLKVNRRKEIIFKKNK